MPSKLKETLKNKGHKKILEKEKLDKNEFRGTCSLFFGEQGRKFHFFQGTREHAPLPLPPGRPRQRCVPDLKIP